MQKFDVIVVGGGHAGLEAAFAAANLNFSTCLITLDKNNIGEAPCNPSIGGPAKGIVTREIDALGGMQGKAADHAQMQMKLLNSSKGAGVWALRAQIDKIAYKKFFLERIQKHKKITLIEDEVVRLLIGKESAIGIELRKEKIFGKKIILTTGTYMKSLIHIGSISKKEGPFRSPRSETLSDSLRAIGFTIIRLKTGTPPRIYKDSIDYDETQKETGTNKKLAFSHFEPVFLPFDKQETCYLTYTNEETHKIIQKNISKSAMYSGNISGVGPRYCPSIEDKIVRFADKQRHQIFIEPESKKLDTMYLQGLSSSLPMDVQEKLVHSIVGLNNARFKEYAYAIEYDAIDPVQLWPSLESKPIKNLYFAGQINGTSGYEEAACQGLMAGINACLSIQKKKPLVLKRSEAYIGVLIDDIVTKGVTDPYRLLTSRAEHRLLLRNDNADDRLVKYGKKVGLINETTFKLYKKQKIQITNIIRKLKTTKIGSNSELKKKYKSHNQNLFMLLKRPEVKLSDLMSTEKLGDYVVSKIEILVKFEGYIKNQAKSVKNFEKFESMSLSSIDDYNKIANISLEARDKLNRVKPQTLGQAKRISGIGISDLTVIKYFVEEKKKK